MVKYSAGVDGVEEDGRGALRSIRKPEWRTRRGCTGTAKKRWFLRLEKVCCTPKLGVIKNAMCLPNPI